MSGTFCLWGKKGRLLQVAVPEFNLPCFSLSKLEDVLSAQLAVPKIGQFIDKRNLNIPSYCDPRGASGGLWPGVHVIPACHGSLTQ